MLYTVVGRSASQMYMLLIVILILSQDPRFSSNMHGFTLPSVPWYSERLLKDMPLGSTPAADLNVLLISYYLNKNKVILNLSKKTTIQLFLTAVLLGRKLGLALVTSNVKCWLRMRRVCGETSLCGGNPLLWLRPDSNPQMLHVLK